MGAFQRRVAAQATHNRAGNGTGLMRLKGLANSLPLLLSPGQMTDMTGTAAELGPYGGKETWLIRGLESGTYYVFRVSAGNAAGDSLPTEPSLAVCTFSTCVGRSLSCSLELLTLSVCVCVCSCVRVCVRECV